MNKRFQIQEMIHQDADGVIFQATDSETDELVAVRRFFLEEAALERLRKENEEGISLFEEQLVWLCSLNIPNLAPVTAGGFDDLDGTPYLVTRWVEGANLAEAHTQGVFGEGDGPLFDSQARTLLLALPVEVRPAILLAEEEVLVTRGTSGGFEFFFFLSPVRFFGGLGGMDFEDADRQQALIALKDKFPGASPGAGVASNLNATPAQLKSAEKGSAVLVWGAIAALLVVLGVGGWLIKTKGGGEVEAGPKLALKEGSESLQEEPEREGAAVEPEKTEGSEPVEEVAKVKVERRSRPASSFRVEEKKVEGEIDLFAEDDDPADEEKGDVSEEPEMAVATAEPEPEPESEVAEEVFEGETLQSATDVKKLVAAVGQEVIMEGVVERVDHSGSDIHWYLEFNKGSDDFLMVVFKHGKDDASGDYSDWESLLGKKIAIEGTAEMFMRGAQRPAVRLAKRADLTVLGDFTVYPISEVMAVSQSRGRGEDIRVEGILTGFGANARAGYLIFEDGPEVQARFWKEGDVGKSQEFREKVKEMVGKKIQVSGKLENDPTQGIELTIHFESADDVVLAE